MTVSLTESSAIPRNLALEDAVSAACQAIAPTWPLDQFIAVNPYWNLAALPIQTAAVQLESRSGSPMRMPRAYFRRQWQAGAFQREHLAAAIHAADASATVESLLAELDQQSPSCPRIPRMTELADTRRDLVHGMSICDFVTHNVSQHCAAYFDHAQATWQPRPEANLYQSWLRHAQKDRTPRLLMGLGMLRSFARTLPTDPMAMLDLALATLPVPQQHSSSYLTALLMSINGWASWCAYQRWQARLSHQHDDHIVQLLAIRAAWETFAFVHLLRSTAPPQWTEAWRSLPRELAAYEENSRRDWLFQDALELAYQTRLIHGLSTVGAQHLPAANGDAGTVAVQAAFCIDVRSEVVRRALEATTNQAQTLGFAGFFGLPIAYTPLGANASRPQLPGLLAPAMHATESCGLTAADEELKGTRRWKLALRSIWKDFRSSASSTFTFVESCGIFFAADLVRNTLGKPASEPTQAALGNPEKLRPCLAPLSAQDAAATGRLCDQLAAILAGMSLTRNFARLLLLVGHGSASLNNPHAAGLDCGACGGQTGEVNARLLASLLNQPAMRTGLATRGIHLPAATHVVAGLHNTTTDVVTLFDTDLTPPSHTADVARLKLWLRQAGHLARTERAAALGIPAAAGLDKDQLLAAFERRTQDWSQVRPEWGLVNNAAFLVAPRRRSVGLNLAGRVFLHEYDAALDPTARVLESIMTAPMLVTNWINMQYYASTVDNRLYGSGNKVLHNVVGGHIGVFEGNGGDLRIGLPLQSLHDGTSLRHTPLRLSVFLEADCSAIDGILQKHAMVRNLVENGWLHLFQIEPGQSQIHRYHRSSWTPADFAGFPAEAAA